MTKPKNIHHSRCLKNKYSNFLNIYCLENFHCSATMSKSSYSSTFYKYTKFGLVSNASSENFDDRRHLETSGAKIFP